MVVTLSSFHGQKIVIYKAPKAFAEVQNNWDIWKRDYNISFRPATFVGLFDDTWIQRPAGRNRCHLI